MAKKIIIGSGLPALLAADILGKDWKLIFTGHDRLYTYYPTLANDKIIFDNETEKYLNTQGIPTIHKVMYSCQGHLTNDDAYLHGHLKKVYGNDIPSHAEHYYKSSKSKFEAGSCHRLYHMLFEKYKESMETIDESSISSISDGVVKADKNYEFDEMATTIDPMSLAGLIGSYIDLKSRDCYYYHVATGDLDFEGSTSILISDSDILFHKSMKIDKDQYIMCATQKIERPGTYFAKFLKDFELIGETVVKNAIPCGNIPDLSKFSEKNIISVGKYAVHDDCLDIGSVIKRLLRMKQK